MSTRPYDMRSRAAAAEGTRERILAAAMQAFLAGWYDDVTIAGVARAAGVTGQTVVNHFGAKDRLFAAACDRLAEELWTRRQAAAPGDRAAAVRALVDDYEITGDPTIRMLALEGRVPAVAPVIAGGRAGHRRWVVEMLDPPPDRVDELVVVTDVYAWKLLRRDRRLSRERTAAAIDRMVAALLAAHHDPARRRS
jgi:AcrR family transcriptional regulator